MDLLSPCFTESFVFVCQFVLLRLSPLAIINVLSPPDVWNWEKLFWEDPQLKRNCTLDFFYNTLSVIWAQGSALWNPGVSKYSWQIIVWQNWICNNFKKQGASFFSYLYKSLSFGLKASPKKANVLKCKPLISVWGLSDAKNCC